MFGGGGREGGGVGWGRGEGDWEEGRAGRGKGEEGRGGRGGRGGIGGREGRGGRGSGWVGGEKHLY